MLYRVTQIASRSLSIWIDIELIMIQSIKLLFNWHCCSRAVANKSFIWQIDAQQNNIDIHIILKGNCPPRYVHTFFKREREWPIKCIHCSIFSMWPYCVPNRYCPNIIHCSTFFFPLQTFHCTDDFSTKTCKLCN